MKYPITALLLGWMLSTSVVADPPVIAEIKLDANPAKSLWVQRGKAAQISTVHATRFRILPGLADPDMVSIQALGLKDFYLRHQKFVLYLHERPKLNLVFESDATFKMVHLEGDKVRFEASKYSGMFITGRDDGFVILSRDPSLAQSTFVLKKD